MATTVNNAFFEFMKDGVNLDKDVVSSARRSRDNLLENITEFDSDDKFFDLCQDFNVHFGSFARKTKCRELDDIDLMIGISASGATYNSSDLWDNVRITSSTTNFAQKECANLDGTLNSNKVIMYSNIEQLLRDISACANCEIYKLFDKIQVGDDKLGDVERLAILLSVPEYKTLLDELVDALHDTPLLVYRIKQFSEHILRDSHSIYDYLKRHEKRVKWHIMRIYRNRNMIVHDGSFMPYRDIIIENLHYYVDVLIDTLIDYYNVDIYTHESIYKHILNKQASYHMALGISLHKKAKTIV